MSFFKCPGCGTRVSTASPLCPGCGRSMQRAPTAPAGDLRDTTSAADRTGRSVQSGPATGRSGNTGFIRSALRGLTVIAAIYVAAGVFAPGTVPFWNEIKEIFLGSPVSVPSVPPARSVPDNQAARNSRSVPDTPEVWPAAPAGSLWAEDLYAAFADDQETAENTFMGKTVTVTGVVSRRQQGPDGEIMLVFGFGTGRALICQAPSDGGNLQKARVMKEATVTGTVNGFNSGELRLTGCALGE